jgi:hypothetical protein
MILLAANTISVMLVPCIHKTVLQLRITLLPRLANHGVELGFGVSNGLTPHIPRVTTPLTLSAVSWPALVMMGTTILPLKHAEPESKHHKPGR